MPGNNYTYEQIGSSQVNIHGKDEKRAYTLVVSSSCAGDFLPFQHVWSGASTRSLPRASAPRMSEARAAGFHFAFANKDSSHYSTFETMKQVYKRKFLVSSYLPQLYSMSRRSSCPTSAESLLKKGLMTMPSQFYSLTVTRCTPAKLFEPGCQSITETYSFFMSLQTVGRVNHDNWLILTHITQVQVYFSLLMLAFSES
jgi:hypothetical protein